MEVRSVQSIVPSPVTMEGAEGATVRVVFSDQTGAPHFAMRQFEVQPGGYTPYHRHPYEHEVLILEGEGQLQSEQGPRPFRSGDAVYVAPDELHQFRNTGLQILKFLCMIPIQQSATTGGSPRVTRDGSGAKNPEFTMGTPCQG